MNKFRYVMVMTLLEVLLFFRPSIAKPAGDGEKLFIYNIALGNVIGGIGAAINKKPSEKWYEAFLKGSLRGSLGGLMIYSGKRLAYQINKRQSLWYGWPANIAHSTGVSIIENAALNRTPWASWNLHLAFLRIEIGPESSPRHVRVLPFSLVSFVVGNFWGKLNLKKSLALGTPYFEVKGPIYRSFYGTSLTNSILINKISAIYRFEALTIAAHEVIHVLQFREYISINSLFLKLNQRMKSVKAYRKLNRYVYLDLPYLAAFYYANDVQDNTCSHKNFYEFEAEYFSTLRNVPVCN